MLLFLGLVGCLHLGFFGMFRGCLCIVIRLFAFMGCFVCCGRLGFVWVFCLGLDYGISVFLCVRVLLGFWGLLLYVGY